MLRMVVAWAALGACGGGESPRLGDDGGVADSAGSFTFTATGTRDGTPFEISRPCFSRLDSNDGTVEAFDGELELGFMVRWARGAVAMTYPNDNFDPEVLVLVIHIVDDNDINEGSQQGTVTFDVLGDALGAEAAGHFDDILLDRVDRRIEASGTFRCQL